MGLDVYLYKYEDVEGTLDREAKASAFSEAQWDALGDRKYETLTQDEKDGVRATIAAHNATLGLDEWGDDTTGKQQIEIDSAKYPEHMFKIGYFRSSYNEGGIDQIARNLIGIDLAGVFGVTRDEYVIAPNWRAALKRAKNFHAKLAAAPRLRVATIAANPFLPKPLLREEDAIRITTKELARTNASFDDGSYGTSKGSFFPTPLAIKSAIPGTDSLGMPCVHLVYEDNESFQWYLQAAEIVIETIEWVLAQSDVEKYRLHWSG